MDATTKFRVMNLTDAYTKISTAEEAFILSRLTENWIDAGTLLSSCASFNEQDFYNMMKTLVRRKAVESDEEERKTVQTQQAQAIVIPIERRYPRLDIPAEILETRPKAVSEECIKEIVFLADYGEDIDLYRRLGLQDQPFNYATGSIRKRTIKYNTFFTQVRKEATSFELLKYLDAAEKAISATKRLLDKDQREIYDQKLKAKGAYAAKSDEKVAIDELHYQAALKFIEAKKHISAMNEIKLALHLNPKSEKYRELEKKIIALQNRDAAQLLLIKLKKNETLMWDERVMKQTLSELFELDNSPSMHLDAARVLANKNAFQSAIEILNTIETTDTKTQEEINALVSDIKKRYKAYKNKF
ncbi:hypothetical protein KAH37_10325 [bacterium]|nr:hypothetical protein [bacterium]